MAIFQVSSKMVQLPAPPKKRARRFPTQWYFVARIFVGGITAGLLFTALTNFFGRYDILFVLLPVFLSLGTAQFQGYNLRTLFNGTLIYLLLSACLTLIYYSIITLGPAFIQQGYSHIIAIATALAWTIMLEPVRTFVQKRIERRFNFRNREAAKTIEAFTATLRDEIDLDSLRERFLTVIQRTIQPYSVSLWTRIPNEHREQSASIEELSIADDDPLIAYILKHPGTLEIDRLSLDSPILQDLKLRTADLILPLANRGELLGLLILGPHLKGEIYTPEERTLLETLVPQVAPALRVAQMVQMQQTEVRKRERIEQELRTARAIQHTFLPKEVPAFPGWQFASYYGPAREVGGDFYDFLLVEDGRLGLVIGDVTGKGVPAALVMATVHAMLHSTVREMLSPCRVLGRVNELLAAEIPPGMFVTCFFAFLDPESGRLRYANAGHELPYLQQERSVTSLWATGMPLGLMPDSSYEEHEITIAPGESLLFYSDGLVEAHNPAHEMFDTPRLKAILAEHTGGASLIDVLLDELQRFTGEGWEQEDDMTLLTLQRTS